MTVEFLSAFHKDLGKLKDKAVREQVIQIIEEVEKAKDFLEVRNVKKLKGHKSAYRIRTGDYRIGIFLNKGAVEFARILNRKDIYRLFP